jgi:hypothetical protein
MNQIGDRFGLRKVNSAIEERTLGELARLRQPRAMGKQCIEHKLCREDATVTGNLYGVLTSERARGAQDCKQHFVHDLAIVDNFSELDCVRWGGGGFERTFSGWLKTFVRDGKCVRSGKADYGKPTFSERRGDGGNGVVEKHFRSTIDASRLVMRVNPIPYILNLEENPTSSVGN